MDDVKTYKISDAARDGITHATELRNIVKELSEVINGLGETIVYLAKLRKNIPNLTDYTLDMNHGYFINKKTKEVVNFTPEEASVAAIYNLVVTKVTELVEGTPNTEINKYLKAKHTAAWDAVNKELDLDIGDDWSLDEETNTLTKHEGIPDHSNMLKELMKVLG